MPTNYSTGTSDFAKLSVFTQDVNQDENVMVESVELVPMNGTATGKDIFNYMTTALDISSEDW